MDESIAGMLRIAIGALNQVQTAGKQNLLNLGGAIDLLEKSVQELEAPQGDMESGG